MESDEEEMKRKIIYHKKPKNRKTKLHLVFDEDARKEFLTGFHKRKVQRQKKAKQELEEQLREERKRLRQEAKESYKKLVVSHRPIPELEEFESKEYDLGNHVVSVVELSTAEIAKKNNWIGVNQVKYDDEGDEKNDDKGEETKSSVADVPGMSVKSEKDIKKLLKKAATKQVQKSKPFQMKNKLEQQKNKKKSLKKKNRRLKLQGCDQKFKYGTEKKIKHKKHKR